MEEYRVFEQENNAFVYEKLMTICRRYDMAITFQPDDTISLEVDSEDLGAVLKALEAI